MSPQTGDNDESDKPADARSPGFTGQGRRQTAAVLAIGAVLGISILIWIGLVLSEEWVRLGQIAHRIAAEATPSPEPDPKRVVDKDDAIAPRPVEAGNPASWFSSDAYPLGAQERGEQGRVVVSMRIDPAGKVRSCKVIVSSGYASLDRGTCRVAMVRGRMAPTRDANGKPIWGSMTLPVRWVLPD